MTVVSGAENSIFVRFFFFFKTFRDPFQVKLKKFCVNYGEEE